MEVDEVAALIVRLLRRLLHVEEEARPVLAQAHRAVDEVELLQDVDVLEVRLVRRRKRDAARLVARLVRVFGAVEADAPGVVVVLPHDARVVVLGDVRGRVEPQDALRADGDLVLPDRRAALGLAVRAEAVGRVVLGAGERSARRVARPPQEEESLRAVVADGVLGREAPAVEAELVLGAAGDGEVALLRRVRTFENAHRVNELGDDEVRVGVSVAVVVARVVDGDAIDAELEVLPLVRVEAAEEDLLGVAGAALVREEEAGRELERVGGVGAGDGLQLADRDLVVGGAVRAGLEVTADVHVEGGRRVAVGSGSGCRRRR